MDTFYEATLSALGLIISLDRELMDIVLRTFGVSGSAIVLATMVGVPAGAMLGLKRFRLRGLVISVLNAFMGLPPVVVGLFLFILFSRAGPMGFMGLLYSKSAMITAQFLLALPIVTALSSSAVSAVSPNIRLAARALGANQQQEAGLVIREARYGMLSAVVAALGRVLAEVGAILLVGGNIAGATRVMTTAIALESDKGDFRLALALGIILLGISLMVNMALYTIQRMGKTHES